MFTGSPRGSISLRKSSIFEVFQGGYEGEDDSGGNFLTVQRAIDNVARGEEKPARMEKSTGVQSAIENFTRVTDHGNEPLAERPRGGKTTGLTTAALSAARDLASGLITSHGEKSITLDDDAPSLSPIRLSPDFIDLGMLVLILLLSRIPGRYHELQW